MSSEKDGSPGNRPSSRVEIKKLPREKCVRCGLVATSPIVVNGKCRNDLPCRLRQERNARRAKR